MPTLQRFGSVSLRMYAEDHNPPHVHIVGPDFQVVVRISDFGVLVGRAKASDLSEALEWAELHRDELARKWIELNERE